MKQTAAVETLDEQDQKSPLTFGGVCAEVKKLGDQPYCRQHRGESGVWAIFLLVVGAIVRWLPGFKRAERNN